MQEAKGKTFSLMAEETIAKKKQEEIRSFWNS